MNELLTMLDTKYKRLEYIQSTGTQWIDTGIDKTTNLDINLITKSNDTTGNKIILSYCSGGAQWFGTVERYYGVGSGTSYVSTILANTKQSINIKILYHDRITATFANGEVITRSYKNEGLYTKDTYHLFGGIDSDFNSSSQIYPCIIKDNDNGTLIRNFIPVMRKSDNEIGMLDLVEGKFYTNAGTGKFTANLDTMYAIIQGSPTVQDGRVSGFSSNNYLKGSQTIPQATNSVEVRLKFFTQTITQDQGVFSISQVRGRGFEIYNNTFCFSYLSTNNTNNLVDLGIKSDNAEYNFILQAEGTNLTIRLLKGTTVVANVSRNDCLLSDFTGYGYFGWIGAVAFNGIIDLNRSYIKIDDTKYKLQAVVGYTVVGSPTIVDGVVSGFTQDDYITLPDYSGDISSLERVFRVNANGESKTQNIILRQQLNSPPSLIRLSQDTVYMNFRYFENGVSTATTLQTPTNSVDLNNYIYIKTIIRNGFQGIFLSDNGVNYQLLVSSNFAEINFENYLRNVRIGNRGDSTNNFSGSIDLPKGYIKINNKLWFNGLPQ